MTFLKRQNNKARMRSPDRLWTAIACCGVAAVIIVGFVVRTSQPAAAARASLLIDNRTDEDVRTGSIFLVPRRGNECQHLLFDNRSGQIWYGGSVDCELALSHTGGEKAKAWSIARAEAIRGAFRWKP
ncbi:MAG: hypothetical protein AB7K04_04305 [Pseudorhodoplanes sp.]